MVLKVLGLVKDIGVSATEEKFNPEIIGDSGEAAKAYTYPICDNGGIGQKGIDDIRKIEDAIGKI